MTTRPPPELAEALDGLADPILLIAAEGRVVFANRAARAELGLTEGVALLAAAADPDDPEAAERLRLYLARCRGSAQPLVGGMRLAGRAGGLRVQCFGSRVTLGEAPHVMLRLRRGGDTRFGALNAKVAELNSEIRRRGESEARLAGALAERDLLLRELQHRVKNNFAMLRGLLNAAAREARGPEATEALREVALRVAAVAAGQQLLYRVDSLDAVEARPFIETIAQAALALDAAGLRLELDVAAIEIENDRAAPLALILNELVTNAVKYGCARAGSRIRVRFVRDGREVELSVSDEGPGFVWRPDEGRRGSGLGLVQGLARQLGGQLVVEPSAEGGARSAVRFACRRAAAAEEAA